MTREIDPLRRTLLAAAALACAAPVRGLAQAQAPAPTGTLVIAGGALRNDNVAVWTRFVEAARARRAVARPTVAVIAAAAGNPTRSAQRVIETLASYGADGFFVGAAPRLKDSDARKAAQDPALAARVRAADGVYFTGGDQGRITFTLLTAQGQPTPLLDAVWAVYRDGGVLGGSSAGAAIMSTTMFFEPPATPLPVLLTGARPGKEIAPGLGFIGPGVFVDQHVIARGRFGRMLPAMLASGDALGLGVDEDTALVVRAGTAEVVGRSGVVLLDLRKAKVQSVQPVTLRDARISVLANGDRVELATGSVTVAPERAKAIKLDHTAPDFAAEHSEPRFFWDMLGYRALTDLMFNLIESSQTSARGVALTAPGDEPSRGFEFRFRKEAGTVGYLFTGNGSEDYTVLNMLLDVAPVTTPPAPLRSP
jgi:cyanophycinase